MNKTEGSQYIIHLLNYSVNIYWASTKRKILYYGFAIQTHKKMHDL